ncbi:MAG: hypothetical protein H0V01_12040 [Bacteroidetes bacterium]|nr:hypothetical protein [Bacteroidota bacterium]HET6245187.1 hypothetical protein [Bacteroidia bacterium]
MKTTKFLLVILFAGFFAMSMNSCKKCKHEDPRARIINNGTKVASVQIKSSGGNTENINNIDPGTISDYRSYAPGIVTYTVSVEQSTFLYQLEVVECFEYDIVIDENNTITSKPTDRND